MMIVTGVGERLLGACALAGRAVGLTFSAGFRLPAIRRTFRQLLRQIEIVGFGSLLVLAMISGLTGMIMVMQMGPTLEYYGAIESLGAILGASFTLELGPIWAAVIVLARVGSAMSAELGTMNVNEEVEALRVMDVDPVRYLVMPRILSLIIALPLLTIVADVVGLAGGAFVGNSLFELSMVEFFDGVQKFIDWRHVYSGLFKAMVFGLIIGTIACDQGLNCHGGAEGVGRATTASVRLNIIFVLLADLILTAIYRVYLF